MIMSYGCESCAFLTSNKSVTFQGCLKVGKYTDTQIELALCDMNAVIYGSNLSLTTFICGEIAVTGAIERIDFMKKDGGKNDR